MKKKKIWKIINESLEKLNCNKKPKLSLFRSLYLSNSKDVFAKRFFLGTFHCDSCIIRFYYPFFCLEDKIQIHTIQHEVCHFVDFLNRGRDILLDPHGDSFNELMNKLTDFKISKGMDVSILNLNKSFYDTLRVSQLSRHISVGKYAAVVKDIHKGKYLF